MSPASSPLTPCSASRGLHSCMHAGCGARSKHICGLGDVALLACSVNSCLVP
jgi:hypothetical protein